MFNNKLRKRIKELEYLIKEKKYATSTTDWPWKHLDFEDSLNYLVKVNTDCATKTKELESRLNHLEICLNINGEGGGSVPLKLALKKRIKMSCGCPLPRLTDVTLIYCPECRVYKFDFANEIARGGKGEIEVRRKGSYFYEL